MGLGLVFLDTTACMTMKILIFTGLMAEKLGSYVPAFYAVGGVIIFGSLLPFLLLWWIEESSHTRRRTIVSVEHLEAKE